MNAEMTRFTEKSNPSVVVGARRLGESWLVAKRTAVVTLVGDDEFAEKYEPFDGPCCRVCGCTDEDACMNPITGCPCFWVEEDLCSACAAGEASDG